MIYRSRKDELENQLNKGALWAVTYGDLMSYLMILFLVLFSFSIAKSDKAKARKYEESISNIQKAFGGKVDQKRIEVAKAKENEESVVSKLQETVQTESLQKFVQLQISEKKVKLVLTEGILFDSGRAELKDNAKKVLLTLIDELKKLPNDVIIEGHTDNVPIKSGRYSTNWELSMARAYSVIEFMEENGISSRHLAGIGYGENRPITDNSTPENKAKNRRIEISLMKTE